VNREQKRMMQRQGQVGADGAPAARRTSAQDVQRRRSDRATPREFFRQVREEMRMTALIFGLGLGCSHFVSFLFTK
jgi:hypothetical protein